MWYDVYSVRTRTMVSKIWGKSLESAQRLATVKYGVVLLTPQER